MSDLIEPVKLPNQIRHYRKKKNLRIKDVALLLEIASPSHIAHWEKGRKAPTLTNALKLSAALGCPVEVLFFDHFLEIRKCIAIAKRKYNINTLFYN